MTLPALPEANVLLAIDPLLTMDNVPALTATFPAVPLPSSALAKIPVENRGSASVPSIETAPATVTETSPPFPGPNVLLAISPLLTMDNVLALTLTDPAAPLLPGLA